MQAIRSFCSYSLQKRMSERLMKWDDLQIFLAVARHGQLARAGSALGIDATTVGRKLQRLERQVGETLFEHRRTGHVLTPTGSRLLGHAEAMERAAGEFAPDDADAKGVSGSLRISVAEGFGTWFIAPRLGELTRGNPGLTIDLVASSGFLSPSRKEADVAILLARPRRGPLVTRKLTDYSLGLYATPAFVGAAGQPINLAALPGLPLISYIPDFIYAPELKYLDDVASGLEPRLRSSSINAQHQLAATGAGVAVLPCFIADPDERLQRVLPQLDIRRTFWLAAHQDVIATPRVRAFIDWLVEATAREGELLNGMGRAGTA
jgi:DNA-binding transcriptional LysR family regulator